VDLIQIPPPNNIQTYGCPPAKGLATLHEGVCSEVSTYKRYLRALIATWRESHSFYQNSPWGPYKPIPSLRQLLYGQPFTQLYLPSTGSLFSNEGLPLSDAKASQAHLDLLYTCQSGRVFRNGLDLDLSINIYTRIGHQTLEFFATPTHSYVHDDFRCTPNAFSSHLLCPHRSFRFHRDH
jgi:hypothetical protein